MRLNEWQGIRQTSEDLSRKFLRTYVKAQIEGRPAPEVIHFMSFGSDSVGIEVIENGTPLHREILMREVDILETLPKPGVYSGNKGDGVLVVRRTCQRQWHEGMNTGTVSILVNGEQHLGRNISWSVALNVFAEQKDIPYTEGVKLVGAGKSLRLSQHYWLTNSKSGQIGLMRYTSRIGSWADDTFYFAPNAKLLQEELKDELGFYA